MNQWYDSIAPIGAVVLIAIVSYVTEKEKKTFKEWLYEHSSIALSAFIIAVLTSIGKDPLTYDWKALYSIVVASISNVFLNKTIQNFTMPSIQPPV